MLDDAAATALDARLASWVDERDLSCAVLLTRGGEVLLEGCYGVADRTCGAPITSATRFGTASVTKLVTASAVAVLVHEGRLRVDDPVVRLLPPERRPASLRDDVAVHHLLCHTSGIADYAEEDESTPGYVEDYASLWRDVPSYRMERPADFLPLFGDRPPLRPPGEAWQYSNAGYVVLGLVLEEVTGRPYVDAARELVLEPVGMASSGFLRLDEAHPDVAVGYLPRRAAEDPWRTNVYSVPVVGGADGGLMATARDLDLLLRRHDDGSLLRSMRDTVFTRHAELAGGMACGYGVFFAPDGRHGHGGGDPGVEAVAQRWPAADVDLVVLANVEGHLDAVRHEVLGALPEGWERG